jgi:hypothetical protein
MGEQLSLYIGCGKHWLSGWEGGGEGSMGADGHTGKTNWVLEQINSEPHLCAIMHGYHILYCTYERILHTYRLCGL